MAGFSSTVRPVGKPAKAPFGVVGSSLPNPLPKPPKAYNVSGYFNGAGQPTFAQQVQSPPVAQAVAKSLAAQGPQAPGQSPGTSGTQTGGSSSGSSGSGAPVLDATALNNIAENQFKANNSINGLNQQASDIGTNLQAALANLAYQQPRDALKLEQGANRRGALYSSAYNQDLGDQTHAYATKETGLATAAGQRTGGIASAIQAILGGIPLYNQGQANASVGRQITAAANNPATGQPASLTPEQVKYIQAGLAGAKTSGGGGGGSSSPKVSGTITDRGPFKRTSKGILPRPKPKPKFGPVGTSGF